IPAPLRHVNPIVYTPLPSVATPRLPHGCRDRPVKRQGTGCSSMPWPRTIVERDTPIAHCLHLSLAARVGICKARHAMTNHTTMRALQVEYLSDDLSGVGVRTVPRPE